MTAALTLGWREWVQLPDLGSVWTKAKIDTGARSSALHAVRVEIDGDVVSFDLWPRQRSDRGSTRVTAPLVEARRVRSSNGQVEVRPVIGTRLVIGDREIDTELTLTDRTSMGFRMLLGRTDLARLGLIDPSRSYLHGRRRADGTLR